jgi:hypothetical protein
VDARELASFGPAAVGQDGFDCQQRGWLRACQVGHSLRVFSILPRADEMFRGK